MYASIIIQVALADTETPTTKTMCTFTVAMLTLTTVIVKEYSTKDSDAISLIRRLIQSSRECQDPMDAYERYRKIAVWLLNPGTFFFPTLYTLGIAWRTPCIRANFGYWMLAECSNYKISPTLAIGMKIMFAGINFWIWSFGMHATLVVGSGIVMIASMHFRYRLKEYRRKIKSVKFDGSKQAVNSTLIYRQIQLLARQYNEIHQRSITSAIIISVVFTQSICLYALVDLHDDMMWVIMVFFGMMAVDCFFAIAMLCGTLADTYDISVKILKDMKRRHNHRGFKWLSRFHRSCQAIKIRFGMTNFMEKLTPLNFENFSLCQTVNLLLVKEE
ncbi:unnamed protein product [Orchesella dallaii]|uniref:Odorant receptor n=1 Tax=Orchesella dallaii TaxID=48710 RepID=A0ABP1QEX8_9HEXA